MDDSSPGKQKLSQKYPHGVTWTLPAERKAGDIRNRNFIQKIMIYTVATPKLRGLSTKKMEEGTLGR